MDIKNVTEGYYNLLKHKIKISRKDIEDMSQFRLEVCASCEDLRKDLSCDVCGCDLNAKTRATKAKCPVGKW